MDTTWTLETNDYGTLTASGVEADSLPMFGIGSEVSLTLFFGPELSDHIADYEALRDFGRYAGETTIDTGTDIRGKPWYRERLHPDSAFSSTLVKLIPGSDVGNLQAYWAVVVGVADGTRYVGSGERLTVDCFLLAEADSYNTRSDVEQDLQAEL
jgi:hypothetical protein